MSATTSVKSDVLSVSVASAAELRNMTGCVVNGRRSHILPSASPLAHFPATLSPILCSIFVAFFVVCSSVSSARFEDFFRWNIVCETPIFSASRVHAEGTGAFGWGLLAPVPPVAAVVAPPGFAPMCLALGVPAALGAFAGGVSV